MSINNIVYRIKELDPDTIPPSTAKAKMSDQGGCKMVVIGKPGCFAKGTKVLMYDGKIKNVEDVNIGDIIMGDDSTPRTVVELCRNVDKMWTIVPKIGEEITVNSKHILTLIKITGRKKGEIIDIPLDEFVQFSPKMRNTYNWIRVPVRFEKKENKIDPYVYGFFLDGDYSFVKREFIKKFYHFDDEVIDNFIENIQPIIPDNIIYSSMDDRISFMAGLLDSKATYNSTTKRFDIPITTEELSIQINYIAGSVGYYCSRIKNAKTNFFTQTQQNIWNCYIYVNTNCILPSKIFNINYIKTLFGGMFTTDFIVSPKEEDQYYGFTIDGNHRFLLGDFSVTHNTGKCHGYNTPIIMYDGSVKMVQDVVIGDKLMGDDSSMRNVLSICNGEDELYEIEQNEGDNYIVNSAHILSLRCADHNSIKEDDIIDIPLNEYKEKDDCWKSRFFGYKVGVEFDKKDTVIDPYLLGLWLGDGTSTESEITTRDSEIVKYLKTYLPDIDCYLQHESDYTYRINALNERNIFRRILFDNNLINNKHVPIDYLLNDRGNRLQLLAGLIDIDGHYDKKGCCYDFVQENEKLVDDVLFLSRSLGFSCIKREKHANYSDTYYRCHISGNINEIPCKIRRKHASDIITNRNHLSTRINVIHKGRGKYYGFELDGNHRYLLGDFTVTHNTSTLTSLLYEKRHLFPVGMVFSGTEDSNGHWGKMFPPSFIYNKLDLDRIEDFIRRQKLAKKNLPNPWGVLLLDDCADDPKSINSSLFNSIFKNGRHWKMWFILSLQYAADIRPVLRSNIDFTFIMRETNIRNRKTLWENYAGVIDDFATFNVLMDELTTDYTALVINNTVQSNNLEDCVFYYKGKMVPKDFKFGSEEFWDFHYARYNEKYVEPVIF